jgi:hypothetical protein
MVLLKAETKAREAKCYSPALDGEKTLVVFATIDVLAIFGLKVVGKTVQSGLGDISSEVGDPMALCRSSAFDAIAFAGFA